MTNIHNVKNKIIRINNTHKIIKAMELIAVNRMKNAKIYIQNAFSYLSSIKSIVNSIKRSDIIHAYLKVRKVEHICIIVISTDHGLCGNLNINLFKKVFDVIKFYQQQNVVIDLCLVGLKAIKFFKNMSKINFIVTTHAYNFNKSYDKIFNIINTIIQKFALNKIDIVKIFSNTIVNKTQYKPIERQLLPIILSCNVKSLSSYWDYIYEPNDYDVLNALFENYVNSQIYCYIIENFFCEQSSRSFAMQSANNNVNDFIHNLNVEYNKLRQFFITQELTEIIAGSNAVV